MSGPQDSAAPDARDDGPAASAVGSDEGPSTTAADEPAQQTDEQSRPGDQEAQASSESAENPTPASESPGPESPGPESPASESPAPESGAPRTRARRRRRRRSFWIELPILVAIALLLAVVIKTFAIQAFWIPSGSMENTLRIGDRVLVNKMVYHIRSIHRGDIVVFNGDGSWDPGTVPVQGNIFQQFASGFASMFGFGNTGDILIKRVIGIPGDRVACCNAEGQVTVNGVPLSEGSYLYPGSAPSVMRFSIKVPPGRLWVMGDNRFLSDDSRDHMGDPGGGTIPESAVIGRAFIIIWPPSHWRILPIPATFEQPALNGSHAAAAGSSGVGDDLLSAQAEPTGQTVPLVLGFVAAIPLTWLQRRVRLRVGRRLRRRVPADRPPRV